MIIYKLLNVFTFSGSFDFFGLNHYTTVRVSDAPSLGDGSYYGDQDIGQDQDPSWEG